MSDYDKFVAGKLIAPLPQGMPSASVETPHLMPWQRACVEWSLERGRAALFEDCGLGKTRQQLEFARHAAAHTQGRALVLAPLAVAQQTITEGARIGIDVAYAQRQADVTGDITITNYERLDAFDPAQFSVVVLDESSILKNYSGKVKQALVEAFASTPFKLACTATPAPNDHLELGNHAEFLGVITSHEMIARWFLPDTSTFGTYRLKGHAVGPFWDWVSSWARCLGRPSDLGDYSDDGYVLPEMRVHHHKLEVDVLAERGGMLFRAPTLSATSVHREKRLTATARALRVAEVVHAESGEPWLVWCDTDYEADALAAAIPDAVEVRGSHSLERKEQALSGFAAGKIRVLITKPSIAGHGLNFQHCARVAFVGPTFSFEEYYQAIRRTWRFGQLRSVDVHVVMAQTEIDVLAVLQRKAVEHEAMKVEMFAALRRAQMRAEERRRSYQPRHRGHLPSWLVEGGMHA